MISIKEAEVTGKRADCRLRFGHVLGGEKMEFLPPTTMPHREYGKRPDLPDRSCATDTPPWAICRGQS